MSPYEASDQEIKERRETSEEKHKSISMLRLLHSSHANESYVFGQPVSV